MRCQLLQLQLHSRPGLLPGWQLQLQQPQLVQSATQLVLQLQLHSRPGLLPGWQLQLQQPQLVQSATQLVLQTATSSVTGRPKTKRILQ